MSINIKQNKTSKPKTRNIEAVAFFNAAQGIPIENALAETRAVFESWKAQTEEKAANENKRLEAEIEINRDRKEEAAVRWDFWNTETKGIAPHFFKFLGFVLSGFLMLGGETMLLQRIADAFGVAEPLFQFMMVGVIVLLLATLVDSVVWFWKHGFNRAAVYVYGSVVLLGLIALGIYRAFILEILEAEGDAVLTQLYDETSYLNKFVMIVLTAGLPIGATFAFEYGWYGLNRWKQWHAARRDAVKFKKLYESAVKKREAEAEKLIKRLEEIDEICNSWQAAQRQAAEEGARLGAVRRPFWEIMPLLIGVSLLIFFLVMFLSYLLFDGGLSAVIESDTGRFALYLLLAFGLILLFVYAVLKRWNSPTPEQFYAKRTVKWKTKELPQTAETLFLPEVKTPTREQVNGKFAKSV